MDYSSLCTSSDTADTAEVINTAIKTRMKKMETKHNLAPQIPVRADINTKQTHFEKAKHFICAFITDEFE